MWATLPLAVAPIGASDSIGAARAAAVSMSALPSGCDCRYSRPVSADLSPYHLPLSQLHSICIARGLMAADWVIRHIEIGIFGSAFSAPATVGRCVVYLCQLLESR